MSPGDLWVADRVSVRYDLATGAVSASDDRTRRFAGGPVAGKVDAVTPKRLVMSWKMKVESQGGDFQMRYVVNLDRASGRVRVDARHSNYVRVRKGSCTDTPATAGTG